MLYATLLAPVLAIPGILLMDRLERWVTTGTRATHIVARRDARRRAA